MAWNVMRTWQQARDLAPTPVLAAGIAATRPRPRLRPT